MDTRETSILLNDAGGGLGWFQQRCLLTTKLPDEYLQPADFQMGCRQCVSSQDLQNQEAEIR